MNQETFDTHYARHWGERWAGLKQALQEEAAHARVDRPNAFRTHAPELEATYRMDPASIEAARALDVHPGHRVLDACASPGGKALILAEALWGDASQAAGSLTLNEPSRARRHRLDGVLSLYLPTGIRNRIRVTDKPGEKLFRYGAGAFDRVLVDAPCSSESHVLSDPQALAEWTPARPRSLAQRQYAILCSTLECLAPGGRLVYSTCSIHPEENDGVVHRVLERARKKKLPYRLTPPRARAEGEATEHGWMFLPDRAPGWGPIYLAVFERET